MSLLCGQVQLGLLCSLPSLHIATPFVVNILFKIALFGSCLQQTRNPQGLCCWSTSKGTESHANDRRKVAEGNGSAPLHVVKVYCFLYTVLEPVRIQLSVAADLPRKHLQQQSSQMDPYWKTICNDTGVWSSHMPSYTVIVTRVGQSPTSTASNFRSAPYHVHVAFEPGVDLKQINFFFFAASVVGRKAINILFRHLHVVVISMRRMHGDVCER